MREYLTASDVANNISMLRSTFKGTILVVEGVTDFRLYGKFIDDDVNIVIAHSKDKVIGSVRTSIQRKDRKVIGICDSDLDLLNEADSNPPVFHTDTRDAESMMAMSEAFDNMLWEYGDREKMMQFEKRYGNIRNRILDASYPIGLLMFISQKMSLNLSFKDMDFYYFINTKSLSCDVDALVREIIGNTRYRQLSKDAIIPLLRDEIEKNHPKKYVCRGHDIVDILVIGLREAFGAYNANNIKEGEVGGALRMAYDIRMFVTTELYEKTTEWCSKRGIPLWKPI